MVKTCFSLLILLSATWGWADTIELKDKAAVTGKVLSEKPDQVAVDVGYTVLVIPRNQISIVRKESDPPPQITATTAENKRAEDTAAPNTGKLYRESAGKPITSNVRELVSRIGESVVLVRTPSGLGSGFIINEQGFLITNFHVIEGETQIGVEVYHKSEGQLDQKSYKDVRIVAMNKFQDLALLKIDDKDAPSFKSVMLGASDPLAVGDRVFAIGSPLGLERTVTEGILSTKTRQMQGELYLQTTAQINPGNSGGPLFNMAGEVIGVTNMKITFGEGLGFAIPIESVRYFLDHRDAYAYSNNNPSNGRRYLEPPSRVQHPQSGAIE